MLGSVLAGLGKQTENNLEFIVIEDGNDTAVAKMLKNSIHETLTYYNYPSEHWLKLNTNNPMERLLKET